MARYDVTFSCGHTGTVQLVGKVKDRESKLEWYKDAGVCPECYKKMMDKKRAELAKEREEQAQAASENAVQFGWPELTGTEKQVRWATTLRQEFYEKFIAMGPDKNTLAIIGTVISRNTNASTWIDNRDNWRKFWNSEYKRLKSEPEPAPTAETTVEPQNKEHPGKVVISVGEKMVSAEYQRNNTFIGIAKELEYKWDPEKRVWARKLYGINGTAVNRAAELGNKLLLAGFAIQIDDAEIRQMAIDGKYKPECKRWVMINVSGKYKGWLCISFPQSDELYKSAKAIPGSKWDAPDVAVPISEWESTLDFADAYNFKITSGAREAIDAYRETVTIATPVERAEEKRPERDVSDVLNTSREVLDDLKDD